MFLRDQNVFFKTSFSLGQGSLLLAAGAGRFVAKEEWLSLKQNVDSLTKFPYHYQP